MLLVPFHYLSELKTLKIWLKIWKWNKNHNDNHVPPTTGQEVGQLLAQDWNRANYSWLIYGQQFILHVTSHHVHVHVYLLKNAVLNQTYMYMIYSLWLIWCDFCINTCKVLPRHLFFWLGGSECSVPATTNRSLPSSHFWENSGQSCKTLEAVPTDIDPYSFTTACCPTMQITNSFHLSWHISSSSKQDLKNSNRNLE